MDFSSDTVEDGAWISLIVFILSAAAVWIGSVLALHRTPKEGEDGGEAGRERNGERLGEAEGEKGIDAGGERNGNRGRDIACPSAVVERRSRNSQLIGGFVARPAFLHALNAF